MTKIILIFASTTLVLQAEDLLDELNLDFELVPVPKEVNPNCGLAISFLPAQQEAVLTALNENELSPLAAYERNGDNFRPYTSIII